MSKCKIIALIAVIMLAFSMTAIGNAVAGEIGITVTFIYESTKQGAQLRVKDVEFYKLKRICAGIPAFSRDGLALLAQSVSSISEEITIYKLDKEGDPCVLILGQLWCGVP